MIHAISEFIHSTGGAFTSYGLAFLGLLSTEAVMVQLGALLLIVRLLYEAIRLWRYIFNPTKGDTDE